jgi:hypothetical protein
MSEWTPWVAPWTERESVWSTQADRWVWRSTRSPKVIEPRTPHRVKGAGK